MADELASSRLDTSKAHAARIYDYWLGGKDNFEADRDAGDAIVAAGGLTVIASARANRRFMVRVAKFLAGDLQFRQFLDFGTGLPTDPNLNRIVQEIAPDTNVIYVDNDPLVLVHARALLTKPDSAAGSVNYLDADLLDPDTIFSAKEVEILDFTRPVAVTMLAVLQLIDDESAVRAISDVMGRLPSGSALALSLIISSDQEDDPVAVAARAGRARQVPVRPRTPQQFTALFGGLELLEPGIVPVHQWRPDEKEADVEASGVPIAMWGGVAIKP